MLSTQAIKNTAQASHYFLGHDNYYKEEQTLGQERSQWWGKGADSLGLSGHVDTQTFTQLLRGTLPDGQQLGKQIGEKIHHRPGFDLTFSVPKSVSLVALLGGDERVLSAVERATDKALQLIERDLAKARITHKGTTDYQKTDNLVVAKFLHDLSREGDPQLHTHCVVMNMTQRVDGKWRSLASQLGSYGESAKQTPDGFLEAVRHHKKYYGAIFRAELAFEMKQLGYAIEKGEHGFFEIGGVSQNTIKAYSQRRKDIESFLQENQFTGAKAAAVATLKTRPSKKHINRDTLMASWQAKAALFSTSALDEIKQVTQQALPSHTLSEHTVKANHPLAHPAHPSHPLAEQAVNDAIAHLSQMRIALREAEIVHQASHYVSGDVSIVSLLDTVETFKKTGELIVLPQEADYRGEAHFTTPALLDDEKRLLQAIAKPHPSLKPLTSPASLTTFLRHHSDLTTDQQQALKTLFSSHDQCLMLEGSAGLGKTHLLKPMMALAELSGYKPLVLTPGKAHSVQVAQQLKSVPTNLREWFQSLFEKKQCDTVAGFLYRTAPLSNLEAKLQKKPFLMVEQAHTLSSKQMNDLVQATEKLGGRILLLGDAKAPLPWQAGSPFVQLLNGGITCARLAENPHKLVNPLKQAVNDTLQGHIQAAFERIGERIFPIENKADRLEVMAAHYVGLSVEARKKACVLMPTQKACEEIQVIIREQLKKQGEISADETNLQVLLPHAMTAAQQKYAASYQVGQWVRFHADYVSLRVNRGDYRQIVGIDAEHNHVLIANAKGKVRTWNPSQAAVGKTAVFDVKDRAIAAGDTLVWRYTDNPKKLHAGMKLHVLGIDERQLHLKLENGKALHLDRNKPSSLHLDYGHASTSFEAYHKKPDTVIAYQSSTSRQSHQRGFYQLIACAKQHAWIYTKEKAQLLKNLQQHTGDKMTAVDALLRQSVLEGLNPVNQGNAHIRLIESVVQRQLDQIKQSATPEGMAQEAVRYALAHLSEREAAFTHKEVVKTALHHALGNTSHTAIEHAVQQAEKSGDLIRGVYSTDGTHWTTPDALAQERAILNLAKANQGEFPGLFPTESVSAYREAKALSQEQGDTLGKLAVLQDRVVLIQGYAGTRKTTLLQHVQTLLAHQQHNLLCLAPTHTAVKELKARGLEGQTLDHFLAQYRLGKMPAPSTPLVIAVDESSMVSNRRLHDFLVAIQQLGARTLIIGDTKQYAAIESGKPFALLQQAGVQTLKLMDITRQRDDTLKKAVKATYAGDFKEAFGVLDKHIVEIGSYVVDGKKVDDRTKRLEAIRDDYIERGADRRAQTLIVTFGNEERILQNALIREKLQAQGELFGESFVNTVLVARNFSAIEQTRASNYRMGDVLRFNATDRALGIEKDQYWTVTAMDAQHNALTLTKDDKTLIWKPPQRYDGSGAGVEVYEPSARDIQAGDLIRWTRTDKTLGLFSAELAKVMAVCSQEITVRPIVLTEQGIKPSGHLIGLKPQDSRFQHWDHAYAMTGYSAQGKTIQEVIIHAESFRPQLTSQPSFLVAITRAVQTLTLYTDDKQALLSAIVKNTGEKFSALETVGELPNTREPPVNSPPSCQVMPPTRALTTTLPLPDSPAFLTPPSLASPPTPFEPSSSPAITSDLSRHALEPSHEPKHSHKPAAMMPPLDAQRIYSQLVDSAEHVVEQLLGEPKTKEAGQYRYGSHQGSLLVTLNGDKRGLWHDFQTGQGGNLFDLIAVQNGLDSKQDFKKVLEMALHVLGTPTFDLTTQKTHSTLRPPATKTEQLPKAPSVQQQKSLRYARQLARESQSLKGTLAERYLREHRHIALENFPKEIRFHPGIYSKTNAAVYPALLVIARDEAQKVHAVQAIFLDPQTAQKAEVLVKKQTWGMPSACSAKLHTATKPDPRLPTYLAEGAETALSVYAALGGGDVRITLGKSNFKNIDPKQTGTHVVLCLDNDGQKPDADKLIDCAANTLLKQGKQVWVAQPKEIKQDYNDVLKTQGTDAVKKGVEQAMAYPDYYAQKANAVTLKTAVLDPLLRENALNGAIKFGEDALKKDNLQAFIDAQMESATPKTPLKLSTIRAKHTQQKPVSDPDFNQAERFSKIEQQTKANKSLQKSHEPEL